MIFSEIILTFQENKSIFYIESLKNDNLIYIKLALKWLLKILKSETNILQFSMSIKYFEIINNFKI